jgi:hypothetical protein
MRVQFGFLLAAAGLLLLAPASALAAPAADPVDLHGAYVLDESGVLGDREGDVRAALDTLFDETGAKAFVVYVDAFEGPSDAQSWADESAERSGLGDADLLLAIATEDRNYAVSTGAAFPVGDDDIDQVVSDRLLPALRDDDWAGGAIAFADGLRAAQAPSPVPAVVGGVAAAGVGTAVVVGVVRSRRRRRRAAEEEAAAAAELDRRAGSLLVQLDDALKTSEQELGFAQAQFGEKETADFSAALAEAKGLAKQAFELRQKLDDAFPETPEQRRSMTQELVRLAEQADAVLDAQAEAFAQLRRLEEHAAEILEQVASAREGLDARIDAAEAMIAELATAHPDADLASLRGLPAQARKLDRFAAETVRDARAVLKKGEKAPGAAVAVRAAQQAVGQVEQLLASVDRGRAEVEAKAARDAETARRLETVTRDARSSVQEAEDYIATHRGAIGSTARTRNSEAARHLEQAVALTATDPDRALAEAQQAVSMSGTALSLAMGDVARAERALEPRQDDAFNGAVLGGILGELFGGDSSSSSGGWWGGGSGGSSWGSSGWGGSSSHHSSGGSLFGGGSHHSSGGHSSGRSSRTSGRRGGSGRF